VTVAIAPWGEGDLPLLQRIMGDPAMTMHLGGPEPHEENALAIDAARADGTHRFVHAYPKLENAPSNALWEKLGFTLLGAHDFEYPKGNPIRCNDWRLDLSDA
jgi:hypothetical protein